MRLFPVECVLGVSFKVLLNAHSLSYLHLPVKIPYNAFT